MYNRRRRMIWFFILAPVAFAAFVFVGGEVVRRLWNWLLPALFSVPEITFWQALGLLVLARILVGGFGGRGSHDGGIGTRVSDRIADRIADRVGERLEGLSPEERERFTQRLRERWGAAPASNDNSGR